MYASPRSRKRIQILTSRYLGLTLYCIVKAAGFLFLIERAYIISWPVNPRHKTVEYVLSCVFIFVPYVIVTALSIK